MNVLITGASGFIGRNLLKALPSDWNIVALYNRDETFLDFLNRSQLNQVTPLRVDLTDKMALEKSDYFSKQYDICIYLAANGDPAYSQTDPVMDLNANTYALLNLVNTLTVGHFIYFSSGAVYDGLTGAVDPNCLLSPSLPYAISKWAAERYIMFARKQGKINHATIVRFFGAYGPYEAKRKIYGRLIKQFAMNRDPKFIIRGDGKNLIDAMHVDDTVRALLLLIEKSKEDTVLDLYSGTPLTLTDLVHQVAQTFDLKAEIELIDQVPEYIQFHSIDRTMEQTFDFKPSVKLSEGLQHFYSWMKINAY